jgi:hypothetical protein
MSNGYPLHTLYLGRIPRCIRLSTYVRGAFYPMFLVVLETLTGGRFEKGVMMNCNGYPTHSAHHPSHSSPMITSPSFGLPFKTNPLHALVLSSNASCMMVTYHSVTSLRYTALSPIHSLLSSLSDGIDYVLRSCGEVLTGKRRNVCISPVSDETVRAYSSMDGFRSMAFMYLCLYLIKQEQHVVVSLYEDAKSVVNVGDLGCIITVDTMVILFTDQLVEVSNEACKCSSDGLTSSSVNACEKNNRAVVDGFDDRFVSLMEASVNGFESCNLIVIESSKSLMDSFLEGCDASFTSNLDSFSLLEEVPAEDFDCYFEFFSRDELDSSLLFEDEYGCYV